MSRRALPARLAALALVALLVAPAPAQERSFGKTTTLRLGRGHKLQEVAVGDVNGDGLSDLIVAASRARQPTRVLRIHLRRDGEVAYGTEPDREIAVLEDVVAIAAADVHADPGDELVFFNARSAWVCRPDVEEEGRYAKLFDTDFLWQLPHYRRVAVWPHAVRDLDGDGLVDLIVPEPGGYVVAIQRRTSKGTSFAPQRLRLSPASAAALSPVGARAMKGRRQGREITIQLNIGGGEGLSPEDLLTVTESTPAPQLLDWDGDGDLDLLAQTTESLLVWVQGAGGRFAETADVEIALPLEVDRQRLLDVSFSAHAADLDGDARADYVLVAGDKRSEDARAQVLVYRQSTAKDGAPRLFGERGRPEQLLVVAGIAGAPDLRDVDGDGLADLVLGSVRLDLLDAIRAVSGGDVDAELYVYRNRGGTFSRSPDLTHAVSLPAKGLRKAERATLSRFLGDLTGDGISELLMRNQPQHVRVHMVRAAGKALTVIDRPLWETRVSEDAELEFIAPRGAAGPEILVKEDKALLHVRFR